MTVTTTRQAGGHQLPGPAEFRAPHQRPPSAAPRKNRRAAPVRVPVLALISGALLLLVVNLTLISQITQYTQQYSLYNSLRLSLAQGATPIGPLDVSGKPVAAGTPVAFMTDNAIRLGHEVIVQGTSSAQTMTGIGHRPDTVMPCQPGSSVLMARSGSYGAVGHAWSHLHPGDTFTIMMGEGACRYRVLDLRRAGDAAPAPPGPGTSQLVLTTAAGTPFFPGGVLRIDADSITRTYPAAAPAPASGPLPASENAMAIDTGGVVGLVFYLQGLVLAGIAWAWMWRRWNPAAVKLTLTPLIGLLALLAANNVSLLLPNLL